MQNNENNNSFFDFNDDIKTDIALSKDELFSIIDQSDQINIKKRKKEFKNIDKNEIEEHIPLNSNNFSDMIAVFSVEELQKEYKIKKKLRYFIEDKIDSTSTTNEKIQSQRNSLLDKFSETKANDILRDDNNIILNEDLEIIEPSEKDKEEIGSDQNLEMTDYSMDEIENTEKPLYKDEIEKINFSEIKSVVNYLDELLDSLPEDKVEEFVKSDYYALYKKVISELNENKK